MARCDAWIACIEDDERILTARERGHTYGDGDVIVADFGDRGTCVAQFESRGLGSCYLLASNISVPSDWSLVRWRYADQAEREQFIDESGEAEVSR